MPGIKWANMHSKYNQDEPQWADMSNDELCRLFMKANLDSPLRVHCFKEAQRRGIKNSLSHINDFWRLKLDKNELLIYAARNGMAILGNSCGHTGSVVCLFIWISTTVAMSRFPDSAIGSSWITFMALFSPFIYGILVSHKILITDRNIYIIHAFFGSLVFRQRAIPMEDCSIFSDTHVFFPGRAVTKIKMVRSKTYFIYSTHLTSIYILTSVKNTISLFELIIFLIHINKGYFYKSPIYAQTNDSMPTAYTHTIFYYAFDSGITSNQMVSFLKNDEIFAALPSIGKKILGRTSLERLAMSFRSETDLYDLPLATDEKILCLIPVKPIMCIYMNSSLSHCFRGGFLAITSTRILYLNKKANRILADRFFEQNHDAIFSYMSLYCFIFSKKLIISVPHICLNLVPMLDIKQFVSMHLKKTHLAKVD